MSTRGESEGTFSGSLIKGTAFRGYRRYLEKRVEPSLRSAILSGLPRGAVELLTGDSLLVSSMYPVEWQHRFLESFASVFTDKSEPHLRSLGAEVAETDLSGVYRVFIWAASVSQTLSVLTKVWNSYFSTGNAHWHSTGPRSGISQITDRHQHPLHHPVVAGYIEVAIRLSGGKNARVTYEETAPGTICFYSAWW